MKTALASVVPVEEFVAREGVTIGRIVGAGEDGSYLVEFPGASSAAVAAQVTMSAQELILRLRDHDGLRVLLAFENNSVERPIIADVMFSPTAAPAPAGLFPDPEAEQEVAVDGKRVIFSAREEIVLKCGEASVTLTSAGKVMIKGANLLSYSTGENRIKGASTSIN